MNLESLNARLDRGWQLSKMVYTFVKEHKKTLFFMIFSALLFVMVLVLLTIILLPSAFFSLFLPSKAIVPALITLLFIFLVFSSFVREFSNVALSSYVLQILNREQPSIRTSLGRAFSRFSTIFAWACINSLIGTWVQILQNKNGTSTINKIIGNMLSSTILLSWNVLTFFTTPVIAAEGIGVLDTIKESGDLMQKQWGKALTARFGIHWIGLSLLLSFYLLFFTPFYLVVHFAPPTLCNEKIFYTAIGLSAFFIPLIISLYLVRTMTIILKTVLYNYANNKPTGPFGKELLQSTFLPSN